MAIAPIGHGLPFLTFYPAAAITVLLAGLGPGLLAVLLGGIAGQFMFLPPPYALSPSPHQILVMATFYGLATVICLIVNQMHRQRQALERATDALAEAESRFRLAQEMSLDAFVILETIRGDGGRIVDFRWLYVNPAAMRGMNMSEADLSRSLLDVLPYAGAPGGLIDHHARVVETGEPAEYELFCGTPEVPRWFRNVVVKVGDGVAVGYSDITARRQAEADLRRSEENFRVAMGMGHTSVFRLDHALRYTWVHSPRIDRPAAALIGHAVGEFFAPESAARMEALFRRVWETGQSEREDITVQGLEPPRPLHLDLSVQPVLDAEGRVEALVGAAHDISDRVAAQAEAEAALAEARRANDAKTRFLAAASHDLRQPLQGLRLLLHILSGRNADPALAPVVATMNEALESTERMLSRLMEFAALESGGVSVSLQTVALDDLVRRVAGEAVPEAAAKGLGLAVRVRPCHAETDPILLERILRNLVANAVRYTDHGRILITLRCHGGQASIAVFDTGHGIPAPQQAAIFDEFHQLENPERDRNKGMGLGLSVVARTADLLGLRLTLRSTEGKGSVFAVHLPCVKAGRPLPAAAPAAGAEMAWAAGDVLLVEDDAIQAAALAAILEGAGWRVSQASDAAGALALLAAPAALMPDLIVSDYRLPHGVSGLQVIRRAREALEHTVPALLITGDTQAAIAEDAAREGCAILHKPYAPAHLLATIRRLRDEWRGDSPSASGDDSTASGGAGVETRVEAATDSAGAPDLTRG